MPNKRSLFQPGTLPVQDAGNPTLDGNSASLWVSVQSHLKQEPFPLLITDGVMNLKAVTLDPNQRLAFTINANIALLRAGRWFSGVTGGATWAHRRAIETAKSLNERCRKR
jgi:hypothetical protein